MTPREFARSYSYDERLVNGKFFSQQSLDVERGERVGVVLMNLGGPDRPEDVEPFLYNLFMDPAIIDLPFQGRMRHWLSKLISKTRASSVREDYEMIGGGSPINRLTEEQSEALEQSLNRHFGERAGVEFYTYTAMRYWHPFSEEAARQMKDDGIDKVVLVPLYPQYSKTTTGSSLMYWHALDQKGEIPSWPTTSVFEYAANPRLICALSERIDEALQRFPKSVRDDVHLLFSAHGTPLNEMKERGDPYCCHVHTTVDRVMKRRESDRPFHVAFQSKVGFAEWLTPSTPDKLEELAQNGHTAVLVIPVAFVTDHIETAYELDIEVREEAEEFGIRHYEVTSGLNCHTQFVRALAESTVAQLQLPGISEPSFPVNDACTDKRYSLRSLDRLPTFHPTERHVRCHQCEHVAEACRWIPEEEEPARESAPAAEAA
jgi:ferrochelatase